MKNDAEPFDRDLDDVRALVNAGRLTEAGRAAVALAAAYPRAAPVFNILGVIEATGGKPEAETSFQTAIALNPDWDAPRTNLGLHYCKRGNFQAASEHLRAALKLRPSNGIAALNLGNALRELGAHDEAGVAYRQALAGGADEALVHHNLGALLLDMGAVDDAIASLQRAISLRPDTPTSHLLLGRAQREKGLITESLPTFEKAAALAPTSSAAAVWLGHTLNDLGRTADAVLAYRRALTLRPEDHEAAYHLGLMLNELGQHGEGLETIRRGPGTVQMKVVPESSAMKRRVAVSPGPVPTFIGGWFMERPELCDQLIAFFENHTDSHSAGRSAFGLDTAIKKSTDLAILPAALHKPEFAPVQAYLMELEACLGDYARQWPFLGEMLERVDIGPFNIQRYTEGGHFQLIHSERTAFGEIHRVLAWMTYLNDVSAGGETTFHHFGLSVRPERGKTLIWPAEWTHAHSAGVVTGTPKYVITGWMHFPHPT